MFHHKPLVNKLLVSPQFRSIFEGFAAYVTRKGLVYNYEVTKKFVYGRKLATSAQYLQKV